MRRKRWVCGALTVLCSSPHDDEECAHALRSDRNLGLEKRQKKLYPVLFYYFDAPKAHSE